jgi:hypothetical protein
VAGDDTTAILQVTVAVDPRYSNHRSAFTRSRARRAGRIGLASGTRLVEANLAKPVVQTPLSNPPQKYFAPVSCPSSRLIPPRGLDADFECPAVRIGAVTTPGLASTVRV